MASIEDKIWKRLSKLKRDNKTLVRAQKCIDENKKLERDQQVVYDRKTSIDYLLPILDEFWKDKIFNKGKLEEQIEELIREKIRILKTHKNGDVKAAERMFLAFLQPNTVGDDTPVAVNVAVAVNKPEVLQINNAMEKLLKAQHNMGENGYYVTHYGMVPPTFFHLKVERVWMAEMYNGHLFKYIEKVNEPGDLSYNINRQTVLVSLIKLQIPSCSHQSIACPLYPMEYIIGEVTHHAIVYRPFNTIKEYIDSSADALRSFVDIIKDVFQGLFYLFQENFMLDGLTMSNIIVFEDLGPVGRGSVLYLTSNQSSQRLLKKEQIGHIRRLGDELSKLCRKIWFDIPSGLKTLFLCMQRTWSKRRMLRLLKAPIFLSAKEQMYIMISTFHDTAHENQDYATILYSRMVDVQKIYNLEQFKSPEVQAIWGSTSAIYEKTEDHRSMFFLLRFARNLAQHYVERRFKLTSLMNKLPRFKHSDDKMREYLKGFDETVIDRLVKAKHDSVKFEKVLEELLQPNLVIPPEGFLKFLDGIYPAFNDFLFEQTYMIHEFSSLPLIDEVESDD